MRSLEVWLIFGVLPLANGLVCYFKETNASFEGFVENPHWKLCEYIVDANIFGGTSNFSEHQWDIDNYKAIFDRTGPYSSKYGVNALCIKEEFNLRPKTTFEERCFCGTDKCNTIEYLPTFISSLITDLKPTQNNTLSFESFEIMFPYWNQ